MKPWLKLLLGIGLVALLHGLGLGFFLLLSYWMQDYVFVIFIAGVGLIQGVYILPLIWLLKRQNQPDLLKGVLIGTGLTLLLGGLCWASMGLGSLL